MISIKSVECVKIDYDFLVLQTSTTNNDEFEFTINNAFLFVSAKSIFVCLIFGKSYRHVSFTLNIKQFLSQTIGKSANKLRRTCRTQPTI